MKEMVPCMMNRWYLQADWVRYARARMLYGKGVLASREDNCQPGGFLSSDIETFENRRQDDSERLRAISHQLSSEN